MVKDLSQQARNIVASNIYMTIATSTLDGKPWISPVFFAFDDSFNLYWTSSKHALHSKLLAQNPRAAIVIFDSRAPEGEGNGVYFEVEVSEITSQEMLNAAVELMNKRITKTEFKIHKPEHVGADGAWKIYRAVPQKVSTLSDGQIINGQYVDHRVEIKL